LNRRFFVLVLLLGIHFVSTFYSSYAEAVKLVSDEICHAFFDVSAEPITIGHGNACANNIMLRHDESNEVNRVAFLGIRNVRKLNPVSWSD